MWKPAASFEVSLIGQKKVNSFQLLIFWPLAKIVGRVQIQIEVKLSWPTKYVFAGSQKPPTEALEVGEPFPIVPRAMERRTYIKKGSENKKIFHLCVVLMVTTDSKTPFRPCSRLLNYTVGVELFTGTGLEWCRGSAKAHFVQFSSRSTKVGYTQLCKSKSKTVWNAPCKRP